MKSALEMHLAIEAERYELMAGPAYHFGMPRRDFFKMLGGGIVIFCLLDQEVEGQEAGRGRRWGGEALPQNVSAWLHVNENGEVTVFTGKVEVGQNIRTSLAQAVAGIVRGPRLGPPADGRHGPRSL